MKKRIHIFGASGSGATTLGKELSLHLPHHILDGDDYFWIKKFTHQREPQLRFQLLTNDLKLCEQWILTGAVCGWGDELKPLFDLVIFLSVPSDVRLQRLKEREYVRYGKEILPNGNLYEQSKAFLEWASLYDTGGLNVRSYALHEHWMSDLECPILRIEGNHTVKERIEIVLEYLKNCDNDGRI
ncbi:AAA family ATPase [Paenibacillus sp. VCA1]|uniref:AAA family ATPase n=1 Tax=Paenibacillus sp. VCA1 TaxID=3039148 RepID=UPI002871107B|nr:AAA family ATPase [Paenibacillus sp. VCA1]MDR9857558.1 AAA family ATPase [Paenibacillus sp. VCA1]